jgi:two-component system, chemotaxis family, chemotaxis protein CheY
MEKIFIICIDDQRDVLDAIAKDLALFEAMFRLEECESADEAEEVLDEIEADGDHVALIISDHVMPGKSGVDFLVEVNEDDRFQRTKKMLLTGLATHEDTIQAINDAAIDRYIEKPWNPDQLVQNTKVLLTEYILKAGINYEPYRQYLDPQTLFEILRKQT